MARFDNHRILITGAGAGIGALMAEEFAKQGAEVIVTARRISAAREVADRIKATGGKAPLCTGCEQDRLHRQIPRQAACEVGPITGLINNAGVVFGGEFEQVSLEQHLNTFRINTEGLMATSHAFIEDLIQAKEGYLVNIASASAFVGLPYGSTYAASKWAVVGFSESIRLELDVRKIKHVHVTTVCPSYISTGMFDGVKTPMFTPMLTPGKVVNSIIKGMQKKTALLSSRPSPNPPNCSRRFSPRGYGMKLRCAWVSPPPCIAGRGRSRSRSNCVEFLPGLEPARKSMRARGQTPFLPEPLIALVACVSSPGRELLQWLRSNPVACRSMSRLHPFTLTPAAPALAVNAFALELPNNACPVALSVSDS